MLHIYSKPVKQTLQDMTGPNNKTIVEWLPNTNNLHDLSQCEGLRSNKIIVSTKCA